MAICIWFLLLPKFPVFQMLLIIVREWVKVQELNMKKRHQIRRESLSVKLVHFEVEICYHDGCYFLLRLPNCWTTSDSSSVKRVLQRLNPHCPIKFVLSFQFLGNNKKRRKLILKANVPFLSWVPSSMWGLSVTVTSNLIVSLTYLYTDAYLMFVFQFIMHQYETRAFTSCLPLAQKSECHGVRKCGFNECIISGIYTFIMKSLSRFELTIRNEKPSNWQVGKV